MKKYEYAQVNFCGWTLFIKEIHDGEKLAENSVLYPQYVEWKTKNKNVFDFLEKNKDIMTPADYLNKLGESGWNLVSVLETKDGFVFGPTYYFKRECTLQREEIVYRGRNLM